MIQGDAAEALLRFLSDGIVPEMIVPCVPVHFAAKALTRYLTNKGLGVQPCFLPLRHAFEGTQLTGVELAFSENEALVVVSKMPFDLRCISACSQPSSCPVTGRILERPMYELMAEILSNTEVDITKVFRSRLLASNVGGFPGIEFKQVLDQCEGKGSCTVALATSCSCHAVVNALKIET
jgi:hypothetical protein